jgi:hypothetical protein
MGDDRKAGSKAERLKQDEKDRERVAEREGEEPKSEHQPHPLQSNPSSADHPRPWSERGAHPAVGDHPSLA